MVTATENKLTAKQVVGYAMGDLGGCMTFALMGSMVTRYYTNVLQVDTRILALLLFIWNIWDAVNDPLMGILMDKVYAKRHTKGGKFRPWILRTSPLLCISAIAFWTVPTFFEGAAMLAVLFFCKILYEGCYTMFNIPMGSLLGAMATNGTERSTLSSARGFGSVVGNVLPLMILPQILARYGDTSFAFGVGAAICAVIGFVFCLLHYAWTQERNQAALEMSSSDESINLRDMADIFTKNRLFVALVLHGICICTQQYVAQTMGSYMYADVLGDIGMMSVQSSFSMVFNIAVLVLCPIAVRRIGLEKMVRICLILGAVTYCGLFVCMGVWNVSAFAYMIVSSVAASFSSVSIFMQWGLVATVNDYHEMVTGKRTEGTIYGVFNLSRRFGQTIGNSAAILAIGWMGYQVGQPTQSAMTVMGIKAGCLMVPAVFLVGSWVAFRFIWNITPELRTKLEKGKQK